MTTSPFTKLSPLLFLAIACSEASPEGNPRHQLASGGSDTGASSGGTLNGSAGSASGGASSTGGVENTAKETGGSANASGGDSGTGGDYGVPEHCADGLNGAEESGVDCGGSCLPCGLGQNCEDDGDCESGSCLTGICLTDKEGCSLAEVEKSPGNNWSDSYSVDGKCYCATTFDHDIGEYEVETPKGTMSVLDVCKALGPGPGISGNPVYNDIQCGNGPANNAGDEDYCPGLVDRQSGGCCTIGPKWDLSILN